MRTYFGGRAEVKGFAVADAAIEGKADRGARAAALGVRRPGRPGADHQRGRRRAARAGSLHVGAARPARGRPGPRGRRTAVEAQVARRAVAGLVAARAGAWPSRQPRRPTPTSRVRLATGCGRASGWSSPSSAPAAALSRVDAIRSRRTRRADPILVNPSMSDATRCRAGWFRAKRPSWRWPTSCSRPGSCG